MSRLKRAACVVAFAVSITLLSSRWYSDVNVMPGFEHMPHGVRFREWPYWSRYGWPYPWYQEHRAWPELGLTEEHRLMPIGVALDLAFWAFAACALCYAWRDIRTLASRLERSNAAAR